MDRQAGPFARATGYAAGIAIVAIAAAILAQIIGRLFGVNLFGMVEVATYAMVAATFIALPYTLVTGGHIRILFVVAPLRPGPRRWVEVGCHALALAFVVYFFYYCADLTLDSYRKGARAQGMLAAPLWVPQSLMTLGILLFALALLHGLVGLVRGTVTPQTQESELM